MRIRKELFAFLSLIVFVTIAAYGNFPGLSSEGKINGAETTGFDISGRVLTEPSGNGAGGVKVRLNCYGKNWSATTKEDGTYLFKGVEPSQCRYVLRIKHAQGVWSERVIVRIKDQDVMAENLYLSQPQSISGTVLDAQTGEPVGGADMRISTDDGDWIIVQTDADGRFLLYVKPRQVTIECNGTSERYYPAKKPENLTVKAGEKINNIDFEVSSAPKFTGQVVFSDGKPARSILVHVEVDWMGNNTSFRRERAGIGCTFKLKTDEESWFVGYLRRPRFCNWQETVRLKAIARLPDRSMGNVARAETNTYVSHVELIKIILGESASAIIRVVDPNGKPIENARVTASDIQADLNKHFGGPVEYMGDGRYLMTGMIPGLDYYMTAHAAGYHTEFGNSKRFVLESGQKFDAGTLTFEWWGKRAVPGLIEKLRNPDEREKTIEMLGHLGPDAAEAIPALINTLKSESRSDVRFKIAAGLGKIGPTGKAMAPRLIQGLIQLLTKDPSSSVRFNIAATLGKLGPEAKAAVPYLIRTLETDGEGPRREAAKALGLIGDPNAVSALEVALGDREPPVRKAAAVALGQLGPAAVKAVPSLTKKLQNDKLLRTEAAMALGLIGDASALSALKAAQQDSGISVRKAASAAIEEIEKRERIQE